jgi:hypothetical protein
MVFLERPAKRVSRSLSIRKIVLVFIMIELILLPELCLKSLLKSLLESLLNIGLLHVLLSIKVIKIILIAIVHFHKVLLWDVRREVPIDFIFVFKGLLN